MLAGPDEVLRALLDDKTRAQWDFGLRTISVDASTNKIMLSYEGGQRADGSRRPDFNEVVQISHLVFDGKFYIIEQINSPSVKDQADLSQISSGSSFDYERVWLCEQVQNRPYFMRITHLAEVKAKYIENRGGNGGELYVKSIAAMRNYLQ